ncbi:hypothetical protein ACQRIU_004249 [Beauveria bassiana]
MQVKIRRYRIKLRLRPYAGAQLRRHPYNWPAAQNLEMTLHLLQRGLKGNLTRGLSLAVDYLIRLRNSTLTKVKSTQV